MCAMKAKPFYDGTYRYSYGILICKYFLNPSVKLILHVGIYINFFAKMHPVNIAYKSNTR